MTVHDAATARHDAIDTPTLVLGLGNPLMGDDAVGIHVARRLAADPRIPAGVEVLEAGTDLLRVADTMAERRHVVLVDAVLGTAPPGSVEVLTLPLDGDASAPGSAHTLALNDVVRLLRAVEPRLRQTRFTLVGVVVDRCSVGVALSPAVARRLGEAVEAALAVVHRAAG
jgi:hydrogenase maturation protease